jgi:prevent-host-death family protein
MQQIAISKFKATSLQVFEKVRRTRTPVRITPFGKPLADIVPPESRRSLFGCMRDQIEICGDIVGPIGAFDDWTCEDR